MPIRFLFCALLILLASLASAATDQRVERVLSEHAAAMDAAAREHGLAILAADEAQATAVARSRTDAVRRLKRLITSRLDLAARAEIQRAILRVDRDDPDARSFFTTLNTLDQELADLAASAPIDLLAAAPAAAAATGAGGPPPAGYVEQLPDANFSASSIWDARHAAHLAKFSLTDLPANWSAVDKVGPHWLQLDFGKPVPIGGVATMGRAAVRQWVTSYQLQVSADGVTWHPVPNPHGGDIFTGNIDNVSPVHHALPRFEARFLRFVPLTWHEHPSMRVEVYPPAP